MIKYNGVIKDSLSFDPFSPAKQREKAHNKQVRARQTGQAYTPSPVTLPAPVPFKSMDPGGVNKNIYNPNAPAKQREKAQNQRAKRRRRRTSYNGTPTAPYTPPTGPFPDDN